MFKRHREVKTLIRCPKKMTSSDSKKKFISTSLKKTKWIFEAL